MDRDPRGLPKAPGPAEEARAVLAAQALGVLGRLQRFRERYGAQWTPAERMWLRLACAEVERYLATLTSPGQPPPGDGHARLTSPSVRSLTPGRPPPVAGGPLAASPQGRDTYYFRQLA